MLSLFKFCYENNNSTILVFVLVMGINEDAPQRTNLIYYHYKFKIFITFSLILEVITGILNIVADPLLFSSSSAPTMA